MSSRVNPFATLPRPDEALQVYEQVLGRMQTWMDGRLDQLEKKLTARADESARELADRATLATRALLQDFDTAIGGLLEELARLSPAFGDNAPLLKAAADLETLTGKLRTEVAAQHKKFEKLGADVGSLASTAIKAALV